MKKFLTTVSLAVVLFAFIGVKPAHANIIDTLKGWKDTIDTVSAVVKNPGENMSQLTNKLGYGIAESAIITTCPQCTTEGDNIPDPAMRKGLIGVGDEAIQAMFDSQPQVNVIAHLANEWVPGYAATNSVYADGYSDLRIAGIDTLWSITRNIAYAGYVIIMIIIGFMIMFRNKIGGQMMVTLGNSLPKIILSLILVTFSFAIIGLIIDFGGFLKNVVTNIYYTDPANAIQIHEPFGLLKGFFRKNIGAGFGSGGGALIGALTAAIAYFTPGGAVGWVIGGLALLLVSLAFIGIVLWGGIKLWITLIKAYFGIILNVVVSPLSIMLGALPGNEGAMLNIFKSALRNVLVFPLAFAIVNLPYYVESLNQGVNLGFPETLTGAANTGAQTGGFLLAIAKIAALYAASSAPAILNSLIPATASKSSADAAGALKGSLAGVPLIGALFK